MSNLPSLAVTVVGHVDSGKSTTVGQLIYQLGGMDEGVKEELQAKAAALGKSSFAFAFFMDKSKQERERGITICGTTSDFKTKNYHYTVFDAPGHRDFIKNMIEGSSKANVCLLLVPADGNFTTAIQKGDHKAGEVEGNTRAHARLINLLGVNQLIVGINKMDSGDPGYKEERFHEVRDEMKDMLVRVGWKKEFVENSVPFIPISGWKGDNLITKSKEMGWWSGQDVLRQGTRETVHVETLLGALDDFAYLPDSEPDMPLHSKADMPLRIAISKVYRMKGVANVLTGTVLQGTLKTSQDVKFILSGCSGQISSLEINHEKVGLANPCQNIGMTVTGLDMSNMPRVGDVLIAKNDPSLKQIKSFTAQVQTLDIPGEIKVGYSPMGCCTTGRSICKITKLNWKLGKETGGKKLDFPPSLKANEMSEVVFKPQQPFVVEPFMLCERLSRIAFLEGNAAVILGKVINVEFMDGTTSVRRFG